MDTNGMSSYLISRRFYGKVSSVTLRFEQTYMFEWHSLESGLNPRTPNVQRARFIPTSKLELERNLAIDALLIQMML